LLTGTPADFGKHIAAETEKGKVIRGRQHQGGVIRPGPGNPLHSMAATKQVQHVADSKEGTCLFPNGTRR